MMRARVHAAAAMTMTLLSFAYLGAIALGLVTIGAG